MRIRPRVSEYLIRATTVKLASASDVKLGFLLTIQECQAENFDAWWQFADFVYSSWLNLTSICQEFGAPPHLPTHRHHLRKNRPRSPCFNLGILWILLLRTKAPEVSRASLFLMIPWVSSWRIQCRQGFRFPVLIHWVLLWHLGTLRGPIMIMGVAF